MRKRTIILPFLMLTGCLAGAYTLSSAQTTIDGRSYERFGYAVADVGDITGDGELDVAVSAPNAGHDKVYVFPGPIDMSGGGPDLDTDDALVFQGSTNGEAGWAIASGNLFGHTVSSLSSVVTSDLVVAAPSESSGRGRVHVVEGGVLKGGFGSVEAVFTGAQKYDYAGWDVAVGDFDGDGHSDLLVGACGASNWEGRVYVVRGPLTSGSFTLASAADIIISGDESGGYFGCQVAAGDLDGDGDDEIIVGAERQSANPGGSVGAEGKVHVFYDTPDGSWTSGNLKHDWYLGEFSGQWLGYSLDAGGDVNGDGLEDLVMGAPAGYCNMYHAYPSVIGGGGCGYDPMYGSVFVVFGDFWYPNGHSPRFEMLVTDVADVRLDETIGDTEFGRSVSVGGDVNADGVDDLLIGGRSAHQAWLWYGSTVAGQSGAEQVDADQAHVVISGQAEATFAGFSVDITADLDGDGDGELFIGAPAQEWYYDGGQSTPGAAYLFAGQP